MSLEIREALMVFQQFNPIVQILAISATALLTGFLLTVVLNAANYLLSTVFDFLKVFFRGPENREVLKDMPTKVEPEMLDLDGEPSEVLYKLGVADRLAGGPPRVNFYGDMEAYLAGWLGEQNQEEEI